jgi:plasmid segregation protein ParM
MKKAILGLDVGYGNVKTVWGNECNETSEIIFRSVAKRTMHQTDGFGSGGEDMNRVGIDVAGFRYLVGPDASQSGAVSTTDADYVNRPEYLALVRGSIYYMLKAKGVIENIDMMVVGLPVSNFATKKADLIKICQGSHLIPTPPTLKAEHGQMVSIHVSKVLCVPQPMGGLRMQAQLDARAGANMNQKTLIIDAGYLTFDWLFAEGMRADIERSGSLNAGVSSLLSELSRQVSLKLGVAAIDLVELEQALKTGTLVIGGKNQEFIGYNKWMDAIAADVIDRFVTAANLTSRFDRILLVGGGAKYFSSALRRRFPNHAIDIDQESVMSNARGFYLIGNGMTA